MALRYLEILSHLAVHCRRIRKFFRTDTPMSSNTPLLLQIPSKRLSTVTWAHTWASPFQSMEQVFLARDLGSPMTVAHLFANGQDGVDVGYNDIMSGYGSSEHFDLGGWYLNVADTSSSSGLQLRANGLNVFANVAFDHYSDSRDDSGGYAPNNFLYTDNSGNLLSAPISSVAQHPLKLYAGLPRCLAARLRAVQAQ